MGHRTLGRAPRGDVVRYLGADALHIWGSKEGSFHCAIVGVVDCQL